MSNCRGFPHSRFASRQRFDIEEMFRDYKSGGYNMVGKSKEDFKIIISPLVKVPPLLRGARGDLYSRLPTPYSLLPTPYSLHSHRGFTADIFH
ncbi:MAG: hypothetical protein F6K26_57060 [Moorea sp. SIO2I5]|nr:hypothetical protein [Moorena sp. SIO2I5]